MAAQARLGAAAGTDATSHFMFVDILSHIIQLVWSDGLPKDAEIEGKSRDIQ